MNIVRPPSPGLNSARATAQAGNALFLILIAVALFAALSYAVTTSGRGGGDVSREKSSITSAQLTQQGAAVRATATRMILTGGIDVPLLCDGTSACIENDSFGTLCTTGSDCVWAPQGGGIPDPDGADITNSLGWIYFDYNTSHGNNPPGYKVQGIGTDGCSDTACTEVLMVINIQSGISESVCNEINKQLGLANPNSDDSVTDNVFNAYDGKAFFCYLETNGGGDPLHRYVHTLVER